MFHSAYVCIFIAGVIELPHFMRLRLRLLSPMTYIVQTSIKNLFQPGSGSRTELDAASCGAGFAALFITTFDIVSNRQLNFHYIIY
jgi:hypothetical protein